MFLSELTPIVQEFAQQPVAFLGGFFSGLLRLSLADDPVKGWLDQQMGSHAYVVQTPHNGNGNAPQSISID